MLLQFGEEFGNNLIMMCLESVKFGESRYEKAFREKRERGQRSEVRVDEQTEGSSL